MDTNKDYKTIPFPAARKVIVDGADAARFANTLKGLIEKATGLEDEC